ncbi:unnamed protein product [Caenorhabditis auriculariae]|uniref:Uncharacterized protein n=1 Tax=Caenorhabditis auriculariae TaxID=2777116 RepID=A0A8S1HF70_9PELO|nr:unnamed protein product [Caenorhabditis auriculariae]
MGKTGDEDMLLVAHGLRLGARPFIQTKKTNISSFVGPSRCLDDGATTALDYLFNVTPRQSDGNNPVVRGDGNETFAGVGSRIEPRATPQIRHYPENMFSPAVWPVCGLFSLEDWKEMGTNKEDREKDFRIDGGSPQVTIVSLDTQDDKEGLLGPSSEGRVEGQSMAVKT